MKYGFAYKNGKLVNIFCGKDELYNEFKAFLVKTFSISVKEVSRTQYIAEQNKKQTTGTTLTLFNYQEGKHYDRSNDCMGD